MLYPSPTAAGRRVRAALLAAALTAALRLPASAQADALVRLPGGAASPALAQAHALGRVDAQEPVALALTLPLRDQAGADDLARRLHDPADPLYQQYLTPQEFTDRFGPTAQDYQAVADYARAQGLTVTGAHAGRLVLDVAGPAAAVEGAFGVHLQHYRTADGRVVRAADAAPAVPAPVAARISGVAGLDTSPIRRPHLRLKPADLEPLGTSVTPVRGGGTGPNGGLSPADIKSAYGLNSTTLDGSGQTVAVFELDGYTPSDIRAYEAQFGLPQVVLQNVLIDGVSGLDGGGGNEVTLDIEMANALAPRISRLLVYEGPNSDQGILDNYARIAEDDIAKSVSTSWGLSESQSANDLSGENAIFTQMAVQGQTIFAAAGDDGAYDTGSSATLAVDDPGSQPYVTCAGATSLTTAAAGGAWSAEGVWNGGSFANGAGGGGVSAHWPLPAYQSGAITAASLGSTAMRNVPDVALNADPNSGYSIYYGGNWVVYGGTSCVAPLWAGFTALVNQGRALNGLAPVGQIDTLLYQIGRGQTGTYASDFHDIAGQSGVQPFPLYYPAVTGYDLATGWGSFQGTGLLADLTGTAAPVAATAFAYPQGLSLFSLPYSGVVPGLVGATLYQWNGSSYTQQLTGAVQRGVGYWARLPSAATLAGQPSGTVNTQPYGVGLTPGWNQIGDPFPLPVALANVQIVGGSTTYSFVQAQSAGLVSSTLYQYNAATNAYVPLSGGAALTPGQGYWLYTTGYATLQVPPP